MAGSWPAAGEGENTERIKEQVAEEVVWVDSQGLEKKWMIGEGRGRRPSLFLLPSSFGS